MWERSGQGARRAPPLNVVKLRHRVNVLFRGRASGLCVSRGVHGNHKLRPTTVGPRFPYVPPPHNWNDFLAHWAPKLANSYSLKLVPLRFHHTCYYVCIISYMFLIMTGYWLLFVYKTGAAICLFIYSRFRSGASNKQHFKVNVILN